MKKFLRESRKEFQKRALKIDKRIRFAISAGALAVLMLLSTFFYFDRAFIFIPIIALTTYFLTYFSLAEGIEKMGWFEMFVMPVLVSISFYLFYFLFPVRWLTRIPFIIFYGISIYAAIVTSNIFNVGVEKSLGLYRAAFSINFLYQAIVSFLFFNLIFALQSAFILNGILTGAIGFLLSLNLFWSIRLKKYLEREVLLYAAFVGLVIGELALLISFLPLQVSVYSLFMAASYYSLAGLVYNYIDEKLFRETIREYILVFGFVLIITFLSLSW
ncbi:hypothetical protein A2970_01280 [Candidatus Roizmanbacteria bacterium RIFCSPLOWO2_01_FULL_44_13]|uniref:Uncharacterized protein n=1 Tax=Candidatus Roizmanbacteria bacterium RIFCSPLOWO2_01_FULL_44_13 TaxID=1802069 RepID=A0A1F7JB71_9BACT|nr:MAG: hypothetical protein A2970_01280 [Candidatus Roizmanbacteria bacterium RIFCSPLOWO2_01_FULL_44_13]